MLIDNTSIFPIQDTTSLMETWNFKMNKEEEKEEEEEEEEEVTTLMEEKMVLFSYNNDPKNPEETETHLSLNQSEEPTTRKRYKGVWRKNGRWIARIRNPITNSRLYLGRFHSAESALGAYFAKKREFESQLRVVKVFDSVMIDNHGFLLGGFSRLDEDLRICD